MMGPVAGFSQGDIDDSIGGSFKSAYTCTLPSTASFHMLVPDFCLLKKSVVPFRIKF